MRVKEQTALKATPSGRIRIAATVYESDARPFESLTVQSYDGAGKPGPTYLALSARECVKFLEFINRIKTTTLDRITSFTIRDREVDTVLTADDIDLAKLEAAAKHDPTQVEALAKFVEQYSLRDLQAVAYRRSELAHFERLLVDDRFRDEQRRLHGGPEMLWQVFFERNPWIFGYGLTYLPLSQLTGKSLEAYIQGRSIGGVGKEADAVMKSNALISGLTVVEIKSPYDMQLLDAKPERSGVYHPSRDLSSAVAQIQVTVQLAVEGYRHSLRLEDATTGDQTGEELHFVQPRAFLVAGHLSQLIGENGVNYQKYRSFETYRRSLKSPEIFTFDELLERARFIVSGDDGTD